MSFSNFSSYPPSLVTALLTVILSVDWAHNRDGFHTTLCCRRFFFASPVSDYYFLSVNRLNHYYEGSDSCRRHLAGRSPRLSRDTFPAFRLQPRHAPRHRFPRQSQRAGRVSDFATNEQARRHIPSNRVRFTTDRQFASSCSPPRLTATQLPSATGPWLTPTRTSTVPISRLHGRTHSRAGGNPECSSDCF